MQIRLDDEIIHHGELDLTAFDNLWKQITKSLYAQERVISYVQINSEKVIENVEQTIINQYHHIHKLEIFTIDEQQLLLESLNELKDYNAKVLASTERIAETFYKGALDEKDWERFSTLIQGIQWIYQMLQGAKFMMNKYRMTSHSEQSIERISKELESHLQQLEEALNAQEYVTVGDILLYELKATFEQLDTSLTIRGN